MAAVAALSARTGCRYQGESGYFAGELLRGGGHCTRFQSGSRLALSAVMPPSSRMTWFHGVCLCLIAGYLTLILLNNMSRQVFP